jgi:hypothetical protein
MANLEPRRRFRFGVRTLLVAFVLLALGLTFVPKAYHRFYSVPLADSVASFNERFEWLYDDNSEPVLTEREVVDAIRAQLPKFVGPDEAKKELARIARTRMLPIDASLNATSAYRAENPSRNRLLWIELELILPDDTAFEFQIRRAGQRVTTTSNISP